MNAPGAVIGDAAAAPIRAELQFAQAPSGRSYLARQYVPYPFHITRPFYLDQAPAGLATVYLQSASGGAYRGDRLALSVGVEAEAAAQVTTQASTLVHAGRGGLVALGQDLRLAPGAYLEYLPDPLILMAEADCESRTEVHIAEDAVLLLCDSFLTHDPEGRGRLPSRFLSELRIRTEGGRTLLLDRFRLQAEGRGAAGFTALAGHACHASFAVLAPRQGPALTEALRRTLAELPRVYASASALAEERGAWVRLLATDGVALSAALTALWQAARSFLTGVAPEPRRK